MSNQINSQKELHVIFGTGPVGTTLADELIAQKKQVRLINRSGRRTAEINPQAEIVKGDALNPAEVRELCRGAQVVYHCANVAYPDQVTIMPKLQKSLLEGLAYSGTKLVVTDTLYMYGQTGGAVMSEKTPFAATSRKGQMRAQLAEIYLQTHQEGKVPVVLGRAADFFGPRVLNSSLGDRVFPQALSGRRAQLLGNIDLPHSYSYIGDVAKGLALLGAREEALGRAWHLPVTTPVKTQREMLKLISAELGQKVKLIVLPKLAIRGFGLFNPFMREFVEMFYQYLEPQIVNAQDIEQTFGLTATPVAEAIKNTLGWYKQTAQK